MPVCEKCHEIDKNAIGCNKKITDHYEYGYFRCEVCNKIKLVYICQAYREKELEYLKKLRGS